MSIDTPPASLPGEQRSLRAGVGHSAMVDSSAAGREASLMAMHELGGLQPKLALLFCTGRHDPGVLQQAVRDVIGVNCRLIGGYSVGVISHASASYDGYEVGVVLMAGHGLSMEAFAEVGLPGSEQILGRKLGQRLADAGASDGDNLLLFYDTIFMDGDRPMLNMATPLLTGLAATLDAKPIIAGMGMIGDMQLLPTHQFFDGQLLQQSVIALLLRDEVRMHTTIMHGCRPASRYYQITRADGPLVLEIDGMPALQVVREMLGEDCELMPDDYAFFLTLGVNNGDRYGDYRESDYANRMCIGVDLERQALIMFENDLQEGCFVQLMRRSLDFGYIQPSVRELIAEVCENGRRVVLAFYIDCAGRAAAYCGLDAEEADEVRKAIPADMPFLGVYSGVEIAPMRGGPRALDWTGVLCLLSV